MELKFKQAVHKNRKFYYWHEWGWNILFPGVFTSPENSSDPSYQYTGVNDKNGRKLYLHSDIVKLDFYEGTRFEVVENIDIFSVAKYDRNRGLFYFDIFKPILHPDDSDRYIEFYYFILEKRPNSFEIIGTIQENPELME
jgi:hypothetical protein